ncbi:MAG TPA: hypothetical protein VLW51_12315 [Solirubrobacteraceae bacterium]|jgi:hypothetical protein|nr:hypothetical protein [Solirubrobacteraceae bacterium]
MSATKPPSPNGKPWTSDYVSSNGATARTRREMPGRLVVLGYITAFAMPLLGLFLGIVVATRPAKATARHGPWIIGISIIASVIWALVFASGALTSTTNDLGY